MTEPLFDFEKKKTTQQTFSGLSKTISLVFVLLFICCLFYSVHTNSCYLLCINCASQYIFLQRPPPSPKFSLFPYECLNWTYFSHPISLLFFMKKWLFAFSSLCTFCLCAWFPGPDFIKLQLFSLTLWPIAWDIEMVLKFLESFSKLTYWANWPKSLFQEVIEKDKEKKKKLQQASKNQTVDVWQIVKYLFFPPKSIRRMLRVAVRFLLKNYFLSTVYCFA